MLVNLAAALRQLDCQPVVGAFQDPSGAEPAILRFARERGLETWAFPCGGRLDRASVGRLRAQLQAGRFDVLHSHGYKANLYGWLAARHQRAVNVATCHNWPNRQGLLAVYAAIDRLVLRRFPRVVAVSEGVLELLGHFGIHPPQSVFIANGIDTARFDGQQGHLRQELGLDSGPVIGTITRLVPGKGVEVLIDAFPAVLAAHPGATLLIVGAGPLEAELKAQAEKSSAAARIRFTGARSDMPAVYSALDVFVLASFDEGMPMTVLEAMSSGRAVIATEVGAIPRLIQNPANGRLIPPRQTEAVSQALLETLADPARRLARGRAARETILRDFSSLAMARQYLGHYQDILQSRKAAA